MLRLGCCALFLRSGSIKRGANECLPVEHEHPCGQLAHDVVAPSIVH